MRQLYCLDSISWLSGSWCIERLLRWSLQRCQLVIKVLIEATIYFQFIDLQVFLLPWMNDHQWLSSCRGLTLRHFCYYLAWWFWLQFFRRLASLTTWQFMLSRFAVLIFTVNLHFNFCLIILDNKRKSLATHKLSLSIYCCFVVFPGQRDDCFTDDASNYSSLWSDGA